MQPPRLESAYETFPASTATTGARHGFSMSIPAWLCAPRESP